MSIKPILFNTEMVQAILDGRKTVTRQVVKEPYHISGDGEVCRISGLAIHKGTNVTHGMPYPDSLYSPGDILYVRETWQYTGPELNDIPGYVYRASDPDWETMEEWTWRPSIHMPKEAARIFLRVTDVRVERLNCFDWDDLQEEGIVIDDPVTDGDRSRVYGDAMNKFSRLWDSTIKPADRKRYGWAANPWVWAIAFERCEKPEETAHG